MVRIWRFHRQDWVQSLVRELRYGKPHGTVPLPRPQKRIFTGIIYNSPIMEATHVPISCGIVKIVSTQQREVINYTSHIMGESYNIMLKEKMPVPKEFRNR